MRWDGSPYPVVCVCVGGPWGGVGGLYLPCGSSTEPSKRVSVQQELSKLTMSLIWNTLEVVFRVRNGASRCSGWGSPEGTCRIERTSQEILVEKVRGWKQSLGTGECSQPGRSQREEVGGKPQRSPVQRRHMVGIQLEFVPFP